jgi:hypothetical protein
MINTDEASMQAMTAILDAGYKAMAPKPRLPETCNDCGAELDGGCISFLRDGILVSTCQNCGSDENDSGPDGTEDYED